MSSYHADSLAPEVLWLQDSLIHKMFLAQAFFPRPNSPENSSCEAGEMAASERFARTCSTRLIPTRAVVIPGVERTNCRARSASFCNPSAVFTNDGRPRDN